jgi:hypothetical protein
VDGVSDTVADETSVRPGYAHRLRRVAGTGLLATLAAMAVITAAAALARSAGVDFELPDGGEAIPLPGFAVMTGFFSAAGVLIAAALLRWSAHPAQRFVRTTLPLAAISLLPPCISGGTRATIATLVVLHLIAATTVIPPLYRALRTRPSTPQAGYLAPRS